MDTIQTSTKIEELSPSLYVSHHADGVRVASVTDPHFCVARGTREEALTVAVDLLKTFYEWKTGSKFDLAAAESKPYVPTVRYHPFVPNEVVRLEKKIKVAA